MEKLFENAFENYSYKDISNFAPSPATYFMDGWSEAHIKILGSEEQITLKFSDQNTSITASSPKIYTSEREAEELYTPVPEPLRPYAKFPFNTPDFYKRETSFHLMQVVSMNMRGEDTHSNLLIGLPFASKYPHIFYNQELFIDENNTDASSFGVVSSLTDITGINGIKEVSSNGYPARSFFGIYHLIETPIGPLFNKKATQMELQPDEEGKLALTLPPIPFMYSLINGPIPLYHVDQPYGEPVGELIEARHGSHFDSNGPTSNAWPWFKPNLPEIEDTLRSNLGGSDRMFKMM